MPKKEMSEEHKAALDAGRKRYHDDRRNRSGARHGKKGAPRADSKEIPPGVRAILAEMLPHLRKCRPISTCCALIGFSEELWAEYCLRYPALTLEVKRVQAERLVEWQDALESGAPGWQAAAVLLERRDAANWSRSTQGRPKDDRSPYASMIRKRKAKG